MAGQLKQARRFIIILLQELDAGCFLPTLQFLRKCYEVLYSKNLLMYYNSLKYFGPKCFPNNDAVVKLIVSCEKTLPHRINQIAGKNDSMRNIMKTV